jgi:hypothetical protein
MFVVVSHRCQTIAQAGPEMRIQDSDGIRGYWYPSERGFVSRVGGSEKGFIIRLVHG